ncbi:MULTISPECIES: hypothetical protein [Sorangium]|uniref:hypothetical protein n=1 Tax=Sorangium TaxID=39643 RepID=UPI003D9BFF7A
MHEDASADEQEHPPWSTMEERIAAVWDLTLECLAWSDPDAHEPRLQRSKLASGRLQDLADVERLGGPVPDEVKKRRT